MRLLLDTHTFIWWDSNPAQLSAVASAALRDPANSVWLSVVSVWEILIKAQLGKLSVRASLARYRRPAAGERSSGPARDIAALAGARGATAHP